MDAKQKKEFFMQAWKEVLGVSEVKDEDNFFEAGGDSIKGVQLVGWLTQKGLKLDMLKLYTSPTVSELVNALEDTQPMAVPREMLTKDNVESFLKDPTVQEAARQAQGNAAYPMQGGYMMPPQGGYMPSQWGGYIPPQGGYMPQQLCTPQQGGYMPQQGGYMPQQLCTPQQTGYMPQQSYMPQWGGYMMPQQLCMPQWGGYMMPQQLCMPQWGGYMMSPQLCMPQWGGYMMPQQTGYMPPQVGYMPQQLCTPQQVGYMPQQPYMPQQQMGMSPTAGTSAPYMAFPTDKPIENPNLIRINEPKLGAVTKSPEDALDVVLRGIFPEGYDKQASLFEQGLDSFKVMQIVTRVGEEGYRVHMQDIMKDPTFKGIVAGMKTE